MGGCGGGRCGLRGSHSGVIALHKVAVKKAVDGAVEERNGSRAIGVCLDKPFDADGDAKLVRLPQRELACNLVQRRCDGVRIVRVD